MDIQEQKLYDYGIRTERSDIRAHVGVYARRVFVFQTREMLRLMKEKEYGIGCATQPGVNYITGKGLKVPIEDIPGIRILKPFDYNWDLFPPAEAATSDKGAAAVDVVIYTMRKGRFPIWFDQPEEEKDQEIQMEGADIVLYANRKIQVKCDYNAGKREWDHRCTGNLFIQLAERNPFKRK